MTKHYGVSERRILQSEEEAHLEEIEINGFSLLKNILDPGTLTDLRQRLDDLNIIQKEESGEDVLEKIGENNLVRLPLSYDERFVLLVKHPVVLGMVKKLIGNFAVLHLQNGIINVPALAHHQGSWHRDLPYQDFVISKPIAISALYCIDDFDAKTGGTVVLPASHKTGYLPSQEFVKKNELQIHVSAGDVILFDSML